MRRFIVGLVIGLVIGFGLGYVIHAGRDQRRYDRLESMFVEVVDQRDDIDLAFGVMKRACEAAMAERRKAQAECLKAQAGWRKQIQETRKAQKGWEEAQHTAYQVIQDRIKATNAETRRIQALTKRVKALEDPKRYEPLHLW